MVLVTGPGVPMGSPWSQESRWMPLRTRLELFGRLPSLATLSPLLVFLRLSSSVLHFSGWHSRPARGGGGRK